MLCLAPLAWLVYRAVFGGLSPNPIDDITDETGQWALRLLLVSLAVTPLRRLTGWNGIIQWRRLLGLFAFFYVCLHLSTYVVLDQFFDPSSILADIAKRRYITVGFAGFLHPAGAGHHVDDRLDPAAGPALAAPAPLRLPRGGLRRDPPAVDRQGRRPARARRLWRRCSRC